MAAGRSGFQIAIERLLATFPRLVYKLNHALSYGKPILLAQVSHAEVLEALPLQIRTPTSRAESRFVDNGPWINWSHGAVTGATITLSSRGGAFLTAFLALFVGITGGQLWRIISYTIHQLNAGPEPKDGMHHQKQAILRNTSSPIGAAYELARLVPAWWKLAKRPFWRAVPLILLALTNLIAFGVAGIFSSEVTKAAGNETLVVSPNCGYWKITDESIAGNPAFQAKVLNDTITAASYARACYGTTDNPLQCSSYTKQQIPWTTNNNASCPFASGMCYYSDTAAFEMDTGPIDSHVMLGINAPKQDRVSYRKVTTCAPLHGKGFSEAWNATGGIGASGDVFQRLFFGPIVNVSNYTYQYNTHAAIDGFGYELTSVEAMGGYGGNTWDVVPALNQTDGDIALFFLTPNSISYQMPCDDPFFSAHSEQSYELDGVNVTYWDSDYYINILGCVDQSQFCNPALPGLNGEESRCTPLTAFNVANDAVSSNTDLGFNDVQKLTASRIGLSLNFISTYNSVNARGSSALQAMETVYAQNQAPLPNDQWTIEVTSWFAVGMAKLQKAAVEFATGPQFVPPGTTVQHPVGVVEQAMCYSQKVRANNGYMSFSVLGVALIIGIGGLIFLTNLVLEGVVGWFQRKYQFGNKRNLQWMLDEKLQLQRLAYEEAGMGKWTGGTIAVPVTKKGDLFGLPSSVDPVHPRLGTQPRSSSAERFEKDGLLSPGTTSKEGHITEIEL
ncbi:MAG: hypothetical protein M1827_003552 [Pycnora praestabilis]|nr:MAG: hypothetical protein M1827_003552 [Pycnora praestabilis]